MLDRTDVVYVASFAADTVMSVNVRIGGRKPAYCTAMGRVLLAGMPEDCARDVLAMSNIQQKTDNTIVPIDGLMAEIRKVREQGYAVIDQELEPGPRRGRRAGHEPARRDDRGDQYLRPHHADLAREADVALPARGAEDRKADRRPPALILIYLKTIDLLSTPCRSWSYSFVL